MSGRVKPLYIDAWPQVSRCIASGVFSALEVRFATSALELVPENETCALLYCYVLQAARQGHLCVTVENGSIQPRLEGQVQDDMHQLFSGKQVHLSGLLTQVGNSFYLPRHDRLECQIAQALQHVIKQKPTYTFDIDWLGKALDQMQHQSVLLPEQAQAIQTCAANALTIVAGGPGTGKSYTVRHLLQLFLDQHPLKVVITAPTGKAAHHLEASLAAFSLQAVTLHALLGIGHRKQGPPLPISADLIIVDEASMIDVEMMARLLQSVKPGARLLFLGDPDQLPPVEAGSLFRDMLLAPCLRPCVVRLQHCVRTEQPALLELAQAVNAGAADQVIALLKEEPQGVRWLRDDTDALFHEIRESLPKQGIGQTHVHSSLLEVFNHSRILSPMRKGAMGVDAINRMMVHERHEFQPCVWPILICRNAPRFSLYNGDVGLLFRTGSSVNDYAIFSEGRKIPALLLPTYEPAFCLSVHKSQGSEYNRVVIVLPEGSEQFGREVIYTALTRARREVVVYGSEQLIRTTIQRHTKRHSQLVQRLNSSRALTS